MKVYCEVLLAGSWDLISKVISTLIGVISIVTLIITLVTKSHDSLSTNSLHQCIQLVEVHPQSVLYFLGCAVVVWGSGRSGLGFRSNRCEML